MVLGTQHKVIQKLVYLNNIIGTKHTLHLNCAIMDKNKQNKHTQGGAWSLYILIDCDNALAGSGKLPTVPLSFQLR